MNRLQKTVLIFINRFKIIIRFLSKEWLLRKYLREEWGGQVNLVSLQSLNKDSSSLKNERLQSWTEFNSYRIFSDKSNRYQKKMNPLSGPRVQNLLKLLRQSNHQLLILSPLLDNKMMSKDQVYAKDWKNIQLKK